MSLVAAQHTMLPEWALGLVVLLALAILITVAWAAFLLVFRGLGSFLSRRPAMTP